jgi:hypothetical protein
MIDWKQVPWPLWVVCAAMLLPTVRIEVGPHGPLLVKILFPALILGWIYLLFRGESWVWWITVAFGVLDLVTAIVLGLSHWLGIGPFLIELILLLLPIPRRHFSTEQRVGSV